MLLVTAPLLFVAGALVAAHVLVVREAGWAFSPCHYGPRTTGLFVYGPGHEGGPRDLLACSASREIDASARYDEPTRTLLVTSTSPALRGLGSTDPMTKYRAVAVEPDSTHLQWWARALEAATPFADLPPIASDEAHNKLLVRPTVTRLADGRWQAAVPLAGVRGLDQAELVLLARPPAS